MKTNLFSSSFPRPRAGGIGGAQRRLGFVLLLGLGLLISASALAQPNTGGPIPNPTVDSTGVPIDGGISLLLASGIGYGLRRLRRPRKP